MGLGTWTIKHWVVGNWLNFQSNLLRLQLDLSLSPFTLVLILMYISVFYTYTCMKCMKLLNT